MRLLPVLLLLGCLPPPECYPDPGRGQYTRYAAGTELRVSPRYGFPVDDPGQELDLERLDRATERVLACLQGLGPLGAAERQQAWCGAPLEPEIRVCLTVQVPPDWRVSPCSGNQVFPCNVPIASCLAKGQPPTPECPCSCRAIIQGSTIVTAPNLELYPARLTELVTGCDQIWSTRLAQCGSPELVR